MDEARRTRLIATRGSFWLHWALMVLIDPVEDVARGLGYRFRESSLLQEALTHSSFSNENRDAAPADNERLEFLGDAVIDWGVSMLLWERFPDATAGEMTRRRADLVREETLADIARSVGVDRGLRLGRGEERSGGRTKPRLLASALEACIAAVYLDGGYEAAEAVCQHLFANRIGESQPGLSDYKTRLQEALQREGRPPPRYRLLGTSGPDHARRFRVEVLIDEQARAEAEGRSKLDAEQEAAREVFESGSF